MERVLYAVTPLFHTSSLVYFEIIVLVCHLVTQKLYHFDKFLDQMSWYKFMEYSACFFVWLSVT